MSLSWDDLDGAGSSDKDPRDYDLGDREREFDTYRDVPDFDDTPTFDPGPAYSGEVEFAPTTPTVEYPSSSSSSSSRSLRDRWNGLSNFKKFEVIGVSAVVIPTLFSIVGGMVSHHSPAPSTHTSAISSTLTTTTGTDVFPADVLRRWESLSGVSVKPRYHDADFELMDREVCRDLTPIKFGGQSDFKKLTLTQQRGAIIECLLEDRGWVRR